MANTIVITQDSINHPLWPEQLLLGVPFRVNIPSQPPIVTDLYLYSRSTPAYAYQQLYTRNKTLDILFSNDTRLQDFNFNSQVCVFSTSSTYSSNNDLFGATNSKTGGFKISRYCTDLLIGNIDLNNLSLSIIKWKSVDLDDINYEGDFIFLSLYNSNDTPVAGDVYIKKKYGTIFGQNDFSNLKTGIYYFKYTFVGNVTLDFLKGNSIVNSVNFAIFAKSIQSITATDVSPTSTTTSISGNFQGAYKFYPYTLYINGQVIDTIMLNDDPYIYTPPVSTNTMIYIARVFTSTSALDITVNQDVSTTFTVYQYVTSITIDNQIIQSSQNNISWVGGNNTQESFKYNTTQLTTTTGSTIFNQNNPINTSNFEPIIPYTIVPYNDNENNNSYGYFYFDSIPTYQTQTLTLSGSNGPFLGNPSTLMWVASYTKNNRSLYADRTYTVTFTTTNTINEYPSDYNTVTISNTTLQTGVPYTIKVVDIIIATNYLFYEKPYNIQIYPGYINYPNTITWSYNDVLNVGVGSVVFNNRISPIITEDLTETKTTINDSIQFWTKDTSQTNSFSGIVNALTANTFTFWNGGVVPLFQSISFSIDLGGYLYPEDSFRLSLNRNDHEFEAELYYRNGKLYKSGSTTPFVWKPYNYAVDYQDNDRLKLKSNQHVNYGLSSRFTFQTNASISVDKTSYSIFSMITSTLDIEITDVPQFNIYLYRLSNNSARILVGQTNQKTYQFVPVQVGLDSTYLNTDVYLSYRLVNSPNFYTIQSPIFQLNTGTLTLDQPNYTIISTIVSVLNTSLPLSFTVQLIKGSTRNELGTTVNNTFSFKAYPFAKTPYVNTNVYLQFSLIGSSITIRSPDFQISSTYFTLNKPSTLTPEFARATSNEICLAETRKKNNVPTTIISIRNNVAILGTLKDVPHFAVPCGVISHLPELNALLKTISVRTAILFIIQKYSIPIPTTAIIEQKRYKYPTADAVVQYPIRQYNTTFRLDDNIVGPSINTIPEFAEKIYDARQFSIVNNDTKSLSSYYTDMLVHATDWLNTLPPLAYDGAYVYCVARPINGSAKQIITATICLLDNQLIFTPLILRIALLFYVPYQGDITILYSSARITDVVYYLKSKYYKTFLDDTTAL